MSQFLINTTVSELIDNLFVEQWITSFNYSSYYKQCLPSLCSYTYRQKFNILYIITLLLGLQGGLTIVLGWISPKIVRILMKVYGKRKRRVNVIQPECPTDSVSIDNIVSNNNNNNIIPTNVSHETHLHFSNRSTIKFILICLFVLSIVLSLILFSIYVARLTTRDTVLITSSTTMRITIMNNTTTTSTMITTTTTPSTARKSTCQLKFQLTTRYRSGSNTGLKSPVAADFNNDNLLDVVFFNYATNSLHVLIGDGNGNYTAELKTFVGSFTTWAFIMAAADFNHDENYDIIFTSENRDYVYLLFGNGNGTFRSLTTIYMGNLTRTRGIGIFDFNNDMNLDLALASQSENTIFVLLGYGNGSFSAKTPYYAGPNTNPSSLALADINGDGYQDIIYNNIMTRTVGVLLGKGDGTFQPQLKSSVGGYYNPSFIAIGDFNGDHQADITVSYSGGYRIGVVLGYGNGTMSAVTKLPLGNKTYYARIATGDFNNDGYSDIVAGSISPYDIYIFLSNGDGNFDIQKIFSAGFNGLYSWMNVADFNNDGCQDILASDDTAGAVFILLNTCVCQKNQIINTSISLDL